MEKRDAKFLGLLLGMHRVLLLSFVIAYILRFLFEIVNQCVSPFVPSTERTGASSARGASAAAAAWAAWGWEWGSTWAEEGWLGWWTRRPWRRATCPVQPTPTPTPGRSRRSAARCAPLPRRRCARAYPGNGTRPRRRVWPRLRLPSRPSLLSQSNSVR